MFLYCCSKVYQQTRGCSWLFNFTLCYSILFNSDCWRYCYLLYIFLIYRAGYLYVCTRTLSPSIITCRCMLQFWLKVVLRCGYGESLRPPFFTYTVIDDEENLRPIFDLDTESWYGFLFSLLLSCIRCCSNCFRVSPKHLITRAGICHLLIQNGYFTGERIVTALHVDMYPRVRSWPRQVKQTGLWRLQRQHSGGIFCNWRNPRDTTFSWFMVRGRNV